MDPLSGVGLAGTVVQFVDFTSRIIIGANQLYKHGELQLNAQVSEVTRDLLDLSTKLQQPAQAIHGSEAPSENDLALAKLCAACNDIAEGLLAKLELLKPQLDIPNRPRGRDRDALRAWEKQWAKQWEKIRDMGQSLRLALLMVYTRDELETMVERLGKYRDAIQIRMTGSILERLETLSIKQSRRFDTLDQETKGIVEALVKDLRNNITKDIKEELAGLAQLFNRRDAVVIDWETQRRVIVDSFQQPGQGSDVGKASVSEEHEKEQKFRNAVNENILQSLYSPALNERYEVVHEAHTRTFQWIYRPQSDDDAQWDSFVDWLTERDGLYWIHGKAGSGKSTLMKYIWNHHLTRTHLSTWAGDAKLLIAHFYFWDLGSDKLQKSQLGLFRSLLYQILSKIPSLIPVVFPQQWAAKYASQNLGSVLKAEPWSLAVLIKSWETLLEIFSRGDDQPKLAIFVDGLDEFEGLDVDMVKLFSKTARLPRIKVCASSRPHVAFESSFTVWPSLRLQDLTYNDIKAYVEDKLDNDESVQELSLREPLETQKLVEEIVDAADGVFLWVYLAVSSLLRGIGNCDEMHDLQTKLRLLPRDLKQLYIHMMLKVDDDYREEGLQYFQLIGATELRASEPKAPKPITVLGLYLARESSDALRGITKSLLADPYQSTVPLCIATSRRVKSRTGGLLEVQLRGYKLSQISPHMKVGYLHRTVREFLATEGMRSFVQGKIEFDADFAMLKSSVYEAQLGSLQAVQADGDALCSSAFIYARRCQDRLHNQESLILDLLYTKGPLSRSGGRFVGDTLTTPVNMNLYIQEEDPTVDPFASFLYTVVQRNLYVYLQDKLKLNGDISNALRRSLIHSALHLYNPDPNPKTILSLLVSGGDPFLPDGEPSKSQLRFEKPWVEKRYEVLHMVLKQLEKTFYPGHTPGPNDVMNTWADILRVLLARPLPPSGAAMHRGQIKANYIRAFRTISRTFVDFPHLNSELEALMMHEPKKCCIQ